jgi:subtilase family serine protease
VQAWVDDVNRIAEGDENNNKLTVPFTVGADLTVTNISWSQSVPSAGSAVTFSATIKNTGSVATPSGVVHGVAFLIDGQNVSWSDTSTASLASGASRTVTANFGPLGTSTWTATSGRKRLGAWVDDINRMTDVNRSNNRIDTVLVIP